MQGEKRETSTKTCNETMLRDKLRVFVSRISPPLMRISYGRKHFSQAEGFGLKFSSVAEGEVEGEKQD